MVQPTTSIAGSAGVMTSLPAGGFEAFVRLIPTTDLSEIADLFADLPTGRPGARCNSLVVASMRALGSVRDTVANKLGHQARAVRVLLLDKSDQSNWAVGWHQDRTIEVKRRRDVPGFGPWTIKDGRPHVAPPFTLLSNMITARIHLDAVDDDNAPLMVAPRSHLLGRIPENRISAVVASCGQYRCLAQPGDVWLYATPILHASDRAKPGRRRRVVQIDFAATTLPGGLEWADPA